MMRHARETQRGSVTLWAVIIATSFMLVVGLVVDGGAKLRAGQKADQVAREAARSAAQAVSGDPILGNPGLVDNTRARNAAEDYLKTAGVPGDVVIANGEAQVTTYVSFQPVFLSAVGIGQITVKGHASAQVKRVYEGAQR